MAVSYFTQTPGAAVIVALLSTDSKPMGGNANWLCLETNTGKRYRWWAGDWEEISVGPGSSPWGAITGSIADQPDLQAALDARALSSHNHDGSYSALGHNHNAAYEALGAIATHAGLSDPHTGYQRETEKGTANGYASLGADGLVPSAQLPASAPAGDLNNPETGSLTVATGKYHLAGVRHQCTGSQRVTIAGTGRLRILN